MRILFLLAILALLLGSWLGGMILHDSGYVLIAYDRWSVETSIWISAALLLVGFVAFYLLLNLALGISRSPRVVRQWLRDSRLRRSNRYIAQGMRQFAEGYWKQARKSLVRSAEDSEMPMINYLVAAWAADRQGDEVARARLLDAAAGCEPEAALAVGITETQILIERRQWMAAESRLHELRGQYPDHPWLMRLSATVYEAAGNWSALGAMLPELRSGQVLNRDLFDQLELRVYLALLRPPEVPVNREPSEQLRDLNEQWSRLSSALQNHADLVLAYAEHLLALGAHARAEVVLRNALKRRWHNELVRVYGLVAGDNPAKQLQNAEVWLRDHPNNAFLLLALGRISLRNELWGKARNYLEASLGLIRSPDAFFELGRLLEHLGENAEAEVCFRRGLEKHASSLLDIEYPTAA